MIEESGPALDRGALATRPGMLQHRLTPDRGSCNAYTRWRRLPDPKRTTLSAIYAVLAPVLAGTACAEQSRGTAASPGVCAGTGSAAAARDEAPGLTAMGAAALYGDLEAVERQLSKGADVNAVSARGLTPLMLSFQPLILPPARSGPDPDATQALARAGDREAVARSCG